MSATLPIVTTPTFVGCPIRKICGYVSANVVREAYHLNEKEGFEQGRYALYAAVMDYLEEEAIQDISDKAKRLGANAIVGFSIRHGNSCQFLAGDSRQDRWSAHAEGTAVVVETQRMNPQVG